MVFLDQYKNGPALAKMYGKLSPRGKRRGEDVAIEKTVGSMKSRGTGRGRT